MVISIAAIFLALVFQFKNAIKPLLVLAAAPYGMVGAFAALWVMNEPFGFMAFLGVASLVGVIVSHSIVLFDFIEERTHRRRRFRECRDRRWNSQASARVDHGVRDCPCPIPLGRARRTVMEAPLLRANRRTCCWLLL